MEKKGVCSNLLINVHLLMCLFWGFGLWSICASPPRVELWSLLSSSLLSSSSISSVFPQSPLPRWLWLPPPLPALGDMGRQDWSRVECISFPQTEICFQICPLVMSSILEIRPLLERKGLWEFHNTYHHPSLSGPGKCNGMECNRGEHPRTVEEPGPAP